MLAVHLPKRRETAPGGPRAIICHHITRRRSIRPPSEPVALRIRPRQWAASRLLPRPSCNTPLRRRRHSSRSSPQEVYLLTVRPPKFRLYFRKDWIRLRRRLHPSPGRRVSPTWSPLSWSSCKTRLLKMRLYALSNHSEVLFFPIQQEHHQNRWATVAF